MPPLPVVRHAHQQNTHSHLPTHHHNNIHYRSDYQPSHAPSTSSYARPHDVRIHILFRTILFLIFTLLAVFLLLLPARSVWEHSPMSPLSPATFEREVGRSLFQHGPWKRDVEFVEWNGEANRGTVLPTLSDVSSTNMSPSWTTILLHASNAPILPRESGRYSALTVNPSTHPSSPTSSPWFLTVTFASETASSSPVEAFFESKSLTGRVTLTLENDHHPSRRPEPKTVTLTEIPPSQATTLRQLTRPKFVGETNEKTRIRPRDAESRNKPDFRKNPTDATPRENHAITIFCIVAAVVAGIIFVLASIRRMFSGVKWSQKMFRMARTRRDGEGNGDGEQESGVENIEMDTQRRRFSESDVRSRSGERRGMSRGRDMDGEREEPLHVQHARSLSGLNRGVFTNGLIPEEDEEMDETRTLTGFRRSSSIEKHPADPLHPKKASLAQRLRNWTRRTKIGTPPSTNGTSALLPHSQENNHQAPFIAASAPSSSSPLSKKENQHPRKPSASMGKLKGCLKYAHRPPPRSSSSEAEGTYSENLVHRARGGSGGAGGSGNENGKDDGQRACSTGSIYTDARSTATGVVGPRAGRGASADLEGGGRRSVSWRLPG